MKRFSKFFAYLMFALCMFTFVSCDSDNDNNNGVNPEEIEALREQYVIDGYVLAWGKSVEFVKSLETRKFINQPIEEEVLYYQGFPQKYEITVQYHFFMDKLAIVYSFLKDAPFDKVKKYISEKYQFIKYDTENDNWIYMDEESETIVAITSKENIAVVSYLWTKAGSIVPPIPDIPEIE